MNLRKIVSICYVKDPSICDAGIYLEWIDPDDPSVLSEESGGPSTARPSELDLASVLDVFTLANWQLAPNPAYQVEVVTSDPKGRVTGMTGLQLVGNVLLMWHERW